MNSIEHHAGLDQHGPELHRLRDIYLKAWSDVAPLEALVAAAERARLLGTVSRAASWERSSWVCRQTSSPPTVDPPPGG